jgi:hypothetical protein
LRAKIGFFFFGLRGGKAGFFGFSFGGVLLLESRSSFTSSLLCCGLGGLLLG